MGFILLNPEAKVSGFMPFYYFTGYMEGRISFKPTYKFDPGTDVWDTSDKQRDPSWTDRILYRGEHLQLTQYRSHWELKMSDHKPVSGLFEAGIKVMKSRYSIAPL